MRLLLDTQVFLWMYTAPARPSDDARSLILDPDNERLLSVASCWEISIKYELGKLKLASPPAVYIPARLDIGMTSLLSISPEHVYRVASLPHHHRDPFDRLLVAQSMLEQLPLLTADPRLSSYGIETIPAS